jgi:hypothetical protein
MGDGAFPKNDSIVYGFSLKNELNKFKESPGDFGNQLRPIAAKTLLGKPFYGIQDR